jgi:EAL domain-containing protein (putative c-di-GMP-specific phosphodiesterase class I)
MAVDVQFQAWQTFSYQQGRLRGGIIPAIFFGAASFPVPNLFNLDNIAHSVNLFFTGSRPMPLQQLVEYFNDRLEQEHNSGFRPFILENDTVHGLFGPIRIGSVLSPIRETLRSAHVVGHAAQLTVAANQTQTIQSGELENLLALPTGQTSGSESIVNFDRLSRAVHMLNYLPQSHLDELLFLDVDPRHILGVKEDHGAYFEEVIVKCGLQTANVAISMTVNSVYARFYQSLLKGLHNYQRRGYRLALKFDYHALEKSAIELISRAAPDFVGLSAHNLERIRDNKLLEKLQQLNSLVDSINGRSIMLNVDDKRTAALARKTRFDLVQGEYFEQTASAVTLGQQPEGTNERQAYRL